MFGKRGLSCCYGPLGAHSVKFSSVQFHRFEPRLRLCGGPHTRARGPRADRRATLTRSSACHAMAGWLWANACPSGLNGHRQVLAAFSTGDRTRKSHTSSQVSILVLPSKACPKACANSNHEYGCPIRPSPNRVPEWPDKDWLCSASYSIGPR